MCPDVDALSQLLMSTLDQNEEVPSPPLDGAAERTEEGTEGGKHVDSTCPSGSAWFSLVPGFGPSPHAFGNMLASWASQEEIDTDSSNEEDDTGVKPDGDPTSNSSSNTNKYVYANHTQH